VFTEEIDSQIHTMSQIATYVFFPTLIIVSSVMGYKLLRLFNLKYLLNMWLVLPIIGISGITSLTILYTQYPHWSALLAIIMLAIWTPFMIIQTYGIGKSEAGLDAVLHPKENVS